MPSFTDNGLCSIIFVFRSISAALRESTRTAGQNLGLGGLQVADPTEACQTKAKVVTDRSLWGTVKCGGSHRSPAPIGIPTCAP